LVFFAAPASWDCGDLLCLMSFATGFTALLDARGESQALSLESAVRIILGGLACADEICHDAHPARSRFRRQNGAGSTFSKAIEKWER
jgi:hypothetical protein